MEKQYIRILKESLCRKKELLEELMELSKKQAQLIQEDQTDWVMFDQYTDQKAVCIDELSQMDEGFESIFDRVKDVLVEQRENYQEDIAFLQNCIRKVTDLGMSLEALERRNKMNIEEKLAIEKQNLGKRRVTAKAATTYYQNARQIAMGESQLMDQKK